MKTTIRLHSYVGTNDGSTSCDFRGPLFIGDAEGDHHKTLVEYDVDETDPMVSETLAIGPQANALLAKLFSSAAEHIPDGVPPELANQIPRLRIGVWDKIAPGTE